MKTYGDRNRNQKRRSPVEYLPILTRNGCFVTGLITFFELLINSIASPPMISA